MSKIQTGQIADGAVTEAKQTMSDAGGHTHGGSGNDGTPVIGGRVLVDTSISGTVNNYNPTGWTDADIYVFYPQSGDVTVTGFESDVRVKKKLYVNISDTYTVTIKMSDAGSDADNQNYTGLSNDLVLRPGDTGWIWYAALISKWFVSPMAPTWAAGDEIFARSSDAGAVSAYWHRLAVAASRIIGRESSGGLKALTAAQARGILGTIEGPASATDNAIIRYDGTTGKLAQNSAAEIDDNGELKIKVYSQAAEPTLNADQFMAMWIDTDDSNRVYLIFRRGTGDQVKVELT